MAKARARSKTGRKPRGRVIAATNTHPERGCKLTPKQAETLRREGFVDIVRSGKKIRLQRAFTPGVVRASTRQTGRSIPQYDSRVEAMAPGKRISARGRVYYEYRRNRTDVRGSRI
jgi:hypothetical protein